jgi:hypothetical protein
VAKISLSLQVKSNVKLVRRNMDNLRKALPAIGKYRLNEAIDEIVRRMSAGPSKGIGYPVPWDSVKQRIKVIILILKKQGQLPYEPTGAHDRGWKSERTSSGAKAYNNVRGSKFLYGTMRNKRQSNIHAGRRPVLRNVYDAVLRTLPKKVKESLKKVPKVTSG